MTNLGGVLKSRDNIWPTKVHIIKSMAFCSRVWMWELGYKEGWVLMDWCFRIVVLEETPESPLNCKEIKPVNTRGNQHWRFIGRTDAKAPILWPPDVKSQLIGKDAGKGWGQEEKGATEDEMVGWHHRLSGREFEKTLGDGEGQGVRACCSPWGWRLNDHHLHLHPLHSLL